MAEPLRINKYLASLGVAARRKVDTLIEEGKVLVNGKKAVLGMKVNPAVDKITVNGKKIVGIKPRFVYVVLNKPRGVVSTVADVHAKRTVTEMVNLKDRIYPVGRLDQDSSGLILLTNDGELANRMMHPRYHVPKIYLVEFLGRVTDNKLYLLANGVKLIDGITQKAIVKVKSAHVKKSTLEITLFEGRKRQIRRMAEKLHLHILSLKRIKMGSIEIGDLEEGKWRMLTNEEADSLKKEVSL